MYQENIKVIQENRPLLYEHLQKVSIKPQDGVVSTIQARNGEMVLQICVDGKTYRMQSIYDKEHEAKVWSEQFKTKNLQNVFVIFGLGDGTFLRELQKTVEENCVILVYEPSYEIFDYVLHHYDMTDLLKNPHFIPIIKGVNELEFSNDLYHLVQWTNLTSQRFAPINVYDKVFAEEYQEFIQKVIENNNKALINRNTAAALGKRDTENNIRNMKYLYESNNVIDLKDKIPEDVPVIIVSAGPSLDKNVEELKAAQGKACIIAVDRALNTLLKYDIIPDFSVTIDPAKPVVNYEDERTHEIPIFYQLSSNYEILYRHTGRKIIYSCNEYLQAYYEAIGKEYDTLSSGGCVGTAALAIAVAMGVKRVIFIGQDLAFPNGFSHTGGARLEEEQRESEYIEVEDVYGNTISTRWDMYTYLLWFNETIEMQKESMEVIDATEGGAKIAGTKIMTLKEAIETYCNSSFDSEALLEECRIQETAHNLEVVTMLLKEMYEQLEKIQSKMKQGINYCNDLIALVIKYQGLNSKGMQLSKKLSDINQQVIQMLAYSLVNAYTFDVTTVELGDVYEFNDSELVNQRKTYDKSRTVYEASLEAAKELKEIMKELVEYYEEQMKVGATK